MDILPTDTEKIIHLLCKVKSYLSEAEYLGKLTQHNNLKLFIDKLRKSDP
jgi:hypothetical protein